MPIMSKTKSIACLILSLSFMFGSIWTAGYVIMFVPDTSWIKAPIIISLGIILALAGFGVGASSAATLDSFK